VWGCRAIAILAVLSCTGCVTSKTSRIVEEFPVTGKVHAGPVCPVQQNPPLPECADRPVPNASIKITSSKGHDVGDLRTDPDGRFTIRLPAGTYTFTPQPVDGFMGTAPPQVITAGSSTAELNFAYDTGIR
jgi:hypothetical protein